MKEIIARLQYLHIAPRKARLVAHTIRGKSVALAEARLRFAHKGAAVPLLKLLRSAIANAKHNFQLDADRLVVQSVRVDSGTVLKRFMPRARGTASPIRKRTSHITLVLMEK
ncbi:50S ribosomal protein L22 [Candidatus Giovannonibacteria bacterium RIFCSPHIGHO2_02_FULL_46_20]|uniref:Large ribosomal subunit protein uL22 n=1 Tax=Candidatus Giovannonibacteria bacterium RIFCSPHIGHO2_02_FULL_46_20 TaxID=1798338 RepID=A0A1F5WFS1_9BACT|nr:MAG: 50S ribosomal protein L22 [Candidatus Giovannonibacteria bacterium RIFCSPHIGHO2_02_FULL_46_20]